MDESFWERLGSAFFALIMGGLAVLFYGGIALMVVIVAGGELFGWFGGDEESEKEKAAQTLSRPEAANAVEGYYSALDEFEYRRAWSSLGFAQQEANVGFGTWSRSLKRNYQMKLGPATVTPIDEKRATVGATVSRMDYDACNTKVWQRFSGTWSVKLDGGTTKLVNESLSRIGGATPVADRSSCDEILPPPPTEPVRLSGGGGDLDCAGSGGSIDGPIRVGPSDPHDLDRNGDGIGCED